MEEVARIKVLNELIEAAIKANYKSDSLEAKLNLHSKIENWLGVSNNDCYQRLKARSALTMLRYCIVEECQGIINTISEAA
jgi:hypothetical protein